MARMAVWTKEMARALKQAVEPFFLFFLKKRGSIPLGKGIIVPSLAVLSVFANIIAVRKNKLVYSVSRILWNPFYIQLFSCPREKPENG